jgi:cellulose synthase operon protein YhjU
MTIAPNPSPTPGADNTASIASTDAPARADRAASASGSPAMGAWSLYFIVKFGLHAAGLIELAPWLNLLLAAALSWPLAAAPHWQRRARAGRTWLAWPTAAALLYHESLLPPLARLVANWSAITSFSATYLLELLARFVSLPVLAALGGVALLWWLGRRRLRWAGWVWAGLLGLALQASVQGLQAWLAPAAASAGNGREPYDIRLDGAPPLALAQLDDYLTHFHTGERGKVLRLPTQGEPAFDLLILSVCSLSWDDIRFAGLQEAPLLQRLDVLFRHFNSAASYSGPAVLRLLHATCGQTVQAELYGAAPEACYLLRNLERAGYQSHLLLNHDGHFDGFAEQLRTASGVGLQTAASRPGVAVAMRGFDGAPILDDYALLGPWWQAHAQGEQRVALLYNTISLHDGNQVPGLASRFSIDTYKPRVTKLFADLERLLAQIEASGRPTVVVLVPEHGGAVAGETGQIAGLRDYPTAGVTHVPAGVALFNLGPRRAPGQPPVVVEQVSSYTSLFAVVASLLHGGVAAAAPERLAAVARALPPIAWVAENDGTLLVRQGGHSFLKLAGSSWRDLDR